MPSRSGSSGGSGSKRSPAPSSSLAARRRPRLPVSSVWSPTETVRPPRAASSIAGPGVRVAPPVPDEHSLASRREGDQASTLVGESPEENVYELSIFFRDTLIGRSTFGKAELRIGRSADNDVQIDNLAFSRHHASIECAGGAYVFKDF